MFGHKVEYPQNSEYLVVCIILDNFNFMLKTEKGRKNLACK